MFVPFASQTRGLLEISERILTLRSLCTRSREVRLRRAITQYACCIWEDMPHNFITANLMWEVGSIGRHSMWEEILCERIVHVRWQLMWEESLCERTVHVTWGQVMWEDGSCERTVRVRGQFMWHERIGHVRGRFTWEDSLSKRAVHLTGQFM